MIAIRRLQRASEVTVRLLVTTMVGQHGCHDIDELIFAWRRYDEKGRKLSGIVYVSTIPKVVLRIIIYYIHLKSIFVNG